MKPELIGKKVTDQIFSCRGGQLVIPSQMGLAASLRGMSNWMQEFFRDLAVGGAVSQFPGAKKS